MQYRHERKHEINASDLLALRHRLAAVAKPDPHAAGSYQIRSLYFDTPADRALREKLDGVNRREKFRIRCYNGDTAFIRLEKKSKLNGLCAKESVCITEKETAALLAGDTLWMNDPARPLLADFRYKLQTQRLQPKTLVDYTRDAYTYAPGNVRVTLDYHIRTALTCTDFLNARCVTIPAGGASIILEVKWDAFLPDIIRDAVQLTGRHTAAFSKYAACRTYG